MPGKINLSVLTGIFSKLSQIKLRDVLLVLAGGVCGYLINDYSVLGITTEDLKEFLSVISEILSSPETTTPIGAVADSIAVVVDTVR